MGLGEGRAKTSWRDSSRMEVKRRWRGVDGGMLWVSGGWGCGGMVVGWTAEDMPMLVHQVVDMGRTVGVRVDAERSMSWKRTREKRLLRMEAAFEVVVLCVV